VPTLDYEINRKHTLDQHYFDEITDEARAYWLGFLWADGDISTTAKRCAGPNRLRFVQKWSDRERVYAFKEALQASYDVNEIHDRATNSDQALLVINSRPICDALIRHGYGRKDERISIPEIDAGLVHHFIRGYFDGDGCLSVYEQLVRHATIHRQELSFTGNPMFIAALKDAVVDDVGLTPTVKMHTDKRTVHAVALRYGKKDDIVKMYDYLYHDATTYLERKYDKFLEYFSYHPINGS